MLTQLPEPIVKYRFPLYHPLTLQALVAAASPLLAKQAAVTATMEKMLAISGGGASARSTMDTLFPGNPLDSSGEGDDQTLSDRSAQLAAFYFPKQVTVPPALCTT